MAFQQHITVPVALTSPVTVVGYWVPRFHLLDPVARVADIVFYGYESQTALQAGKPPLTSHEFVITGATFANYFSQAAMVASGNTIYAQAYIAAKALADPINAQQRRQGVTPTVFFQNATNV